MKKLMVLKKKKKVEKVTRQMGDMIEMNLEEISAVRSAMFDLKLSNVDIEIEDDMADDLSLVEMYRAVTKTGFFDVLSIG